MPAAATPKPFDIQANDIRMFGLHYAGEGPTMLLLHSLSGNARIFDGLVSAGLSPEFELLAPDMRGRGRTEAPLSGYSLENGCADIIALLDQLGVSQVVVCGHSFGGLLGIYLAAHHPERVSHLILLDAAAEMHPATPVMVASVAARLDKVFPSREAYREMVKMAPFVNRWYEEMNGFVQADVQTVAPGILTSSTRSFTATMAAMHVYAHSKQDWRNHLSKVRQPALLVQATEPFLMGMPLVTDEKAVETVNLLERGVLSRATGNHFTMLFGPGAEDITSAIRAFVRADL